MRLWLPLFWLPLFIRRFYCTFVRFDPGHRPGEIIYVGNCPRRHEYEIGPELPDRGAL